MKESWEKHIQPLLDSHQGDNLTPLGDPFLERYPKLTGRQRIEVEDTLVRCAFDPSDDEMARKALTLAVALHASQLATGGLARLMRDELRNQLRMLDMNRDITHEYISACSAFGLTEAVPSIRALAASVSQGLMSGGPDEAEVSGRSLQRACCLSLRRLGDEQAEEFVANLVEHDLRMNTLTTSELESLSPERIVHSLDDIGPSALRSIIGFFRGQVDQRARAMQLLQQAAQAIDFNSDQERQEVMGLIAGLRNIHEAQTPSRLDERMSTIKRKRSTQNALTGLVLSIISLGFLVALLVLGRSFFLPVRATIYGVITILATLFFGFASAFSTLYDVRTSRTNNVAFVLAAVALAVCALVFVGLGWLAYLILA
ncbi:MAG TPA: hypothetical protein VJK02_14365 [Anaerolineales bacterium]|nr:hypothetical protein [Anaerolineales bacterium]